MASYEEIRDDLAERVDRVRSEIKDREYRIGDLETKKTNLEEKINLVKDELPEIASMYQSEINEIDEELNGLRTELSKLKEKYLDLVDKFSMVMKKTI